MLVLLVIHDFLFFGIKLLFVSLNPHLSSGLGQQKNFEFLYYSFIHDHLCGWHWWRLHTFILSLTLGKSSKINKRKKALKNSKLETSQMMYYAQNFFFFVFRISFLVSEIYHNFRCFIHVWKSSDLNYLGTCGRPARQEAGYHHGYHSRVS